jgi:hypothetical protein
LGSFVPVFRLGLRLLVTGGLNENTQLSEQGIVIMYVDSVRTTLWEYSITLLLK